MPEPFELQSDEELALYLLVIEELKRQYRRIVDDPTLVLQDAFWAEMAGLFIASTVPQLIDVGERGARLALAEVEELPPDLFEDVRLAARQRGGELIRNITETTRNQVVDLLDSSIIENWTEDQLTEALTGLPGSPFGETRARLIAITETTTMYIDGAGIAAEELRNQGYVVNVIWQTVRDDLVCPICEPRQGTAQGTLWDELRAAHPGCRCFVVLEATKMG